MTNMHKMKLEKCPDCHIFMRRMLLIIEDRPSEEFLKCHKCGQCKYQSRYEKRAEQAKTQSEET